jgi:hypothetical protein
MASISTDSVEKLILDINLIFHHSHLLLIEAGIKPLLLLTG